MNTEQLKTAEEILNEKRSDWTYEARNDQRPVSTQLILDAMNSFASQESKIAVSEFKEKLKDKINDSALTHQEKLYFKHLIDS